MSIDAARLLVVSQVFLEMRRGLFGSVEANIPLSMATNRN